MGRLTTLDHTTWICRSVRALPADPRWRRRCRSATTRRGSPEVYRSPLYHAHIRAPRSLSEGAPGARTTDAAATTGPEPRVDYCVVQLVGNTATQRSLTILPPFISHSATVQELELRQSLPQFKAGPATNCASCPPSPRRLPHHFDCRPTARVPAHMIPCSRQAPPPPARAGRPAGDIPPTCIPGTCSTSEVGGQFDNQIDPLPTPFSVCVREPVGWPYRRARSFAMQ